MAKCNCGAQTCGCRIEAGAGVSIEGAGTPGSPWVISAEGGGGGGESGWASGDLKDTVRTVTDAGWLECNGQAVSRATYPALFTAIGTIWGAGDGVNTFNIPNFAGVFRMGAGPGYPAGGSGGAAATTLSVANLPPHTHTISHNHTMAHTHSIAHTHTMPHTHGMVHDHGAVVSSEAGAHDHDLSYGSTYNGTGGKVARGGTSETANSGGAVSSVPDHTHNVNLPNYVGNTGSATLSETSAPSLANSGQASLDTTSIPSTPNSGSTGSASSFTNLPPYRAVRVLIKT